MAWAGDLARSPGLFFLLVTLAFACLGGIHRFGSRRLGWGTILGVALVVRLLAVPLEPTLSEDVYRYLWDGRVAATGHNPYRFTPNAPELVDLRDGLWARTAHRDVETVYPPAAMALFVAAAGLPSPVVAFKTLVALIDLVGLALLLVLLRRLQRSESTAIWYGWNPLVILEGAGMGHVDVVGAAFLVLGALLLVTWRRHLGRALAGVAVAIGVLIKLVPVVLLPLWWARSRPHGVSFLAAATLLSAAALVPLGISTQGVPPGLVTYGVSWEFNGPVFEPLWRLIDVLGVDRLSKSLLEGIKQTLGVHEPLNVVFPYLYPQLLAKALLLIVALYVVRSRLRSGLLDGTRDTLGLCLLLTATVYPWYLVWVLPFAAATLSWPWLGLSYLIQLSYLPKLAGVEAFPWTYLAVWLPFAALLYKFRVRERSA